MDDGPTDGRTAVVLAIDGGNPAVARWFVRVERVTNVVSALGLVLVLVLNADPGVALLWTAFTAIVVGWFGWMNRALVRGDEVIGGLDPAGALICDAAGLRIHHPSALAEDGFVPWSGVTAIVIDKGRARGFPYEAAGKRQYLLDVPGVGLTPHHHPPLVSAAPVRPNVLVIVDPPVVLPWSHPEPRARAFARASAQPWGAPSSTPAFWVRVENLGDLRRHPEARARIRPLDKTDVHRLRYELGDLPGPNPYRRDRRSD